MNTGVYRVFNLKIRKMKTKFFFVFALIAFSVSITYAQDSNTDGHTVTIGVPEVALIDIEPAASKNISLEYTAPTEAGNPLVAVTNTDLWLNYSSIKSSTNPTRSVTVKVSQVIAGADLKVSAGSDNGAGDGTVGVPGAALTLTTSDQTLISGIGSCYTGDGASSGHNLTYSLDLANSGGNTYADLEAVASSAITVTYTISNN